MTALTPRFPAKIFVHRLAELEVDGLVNPWSGSNAEASRRRDTLCQHLWQILPQFILLSNQCTAIDALATGVPLVSQSAVDANLVSYLLPPSSPSALITPDYSCAIWRALNLHGMGRYSLAFSLLPLISQDAKPPHREQLLHLSRWAEQLVRYYSGIKVIAFGSGVSSILHSRGIGHALLEPPGRVGINLFDQIQALRKAGLRGWDESDEVQSQGSVPSP